MKSLKKIAALIAVIACVFGMTVFAGAADATPATIVAKLEAGASNGAKVPAEWINMAEHILADHPEFTAEQLNKIDAAIDQVFEYVVANTLTTTSDVIGNLAAVQYIVDKATEVAPSLGLTVSANIPGRTVTVTDSSNGDVYTFTGEGSATGNVGHATVTHTGASNMNLIIAGIASAMLLAAAAVVVFRKKQVA